MTDNQGPVRIGPAFLERRLDAGTLLSVAVPIYNEEESLPVLFDRLEAVAADLPVSVEFVLVNDGSRDRSLDLMIQKAVADHRYRVVDLSRNFGHQSAVSAAMTVVRGQVAAVIDADLQDPPELFKPMLERWAQGADVVYGRRRTRAGESAFKKGTASLFYRVLNRLSDNPIPRDTGDFRIMDRTVVDAFNAMPEHHRFLRGMIAWLGFSQEEILYDRMPREAGVTKYPLKKMLALSFDAIFSFSMKPLRWIAILGFGMTALSFLVALVLAIIRLLIFRQDFVPGVATIFVSVWFLFGLNFLVLGVLGEYMGRTFTNVQGRPIFIIRHVYEKGPPAAGRE